MVKDANLLVTHLMRFVHNGFLNFQRVLWLDVRAILVETKMYNSIQNTLPHSLFHFWLEQSATKNINTLVHFQSICKKSHGNCFNLKKNSLMFSIYSKHNMFALTKQPFLTMLQYLFCSYCVP